MVFGFGKSKSKKVLQQFPMQQGQGMSGMQHFRTHLEILEGKGEGSKDRAMIALHKISDCRSKGRETEKALFDFEDGRIVKAAREIVRGEGGGYRMVALLLLRFFCCRGIPD